MKGRNVRQLVREMKELNSQSNDDQQNLSELQDDVEKLQAKLKMYRV